MGGTFASDMTKGTPSYDTAPSPAVSARMSQIRSKDTKPELLVRRYLHAQGFRYRLHEKRLPGTPDIVLPKYKSVVIVQGCFWHRHGVGCGIKAKVPRSNLSFWEPKLQRNVQRDQTTQAQLRASGWEVIVIWECDLKKSARGATLNQLNSALLNADVIGSGSLFAAAQTSLGSLTTIFP